MPKADRPSVAELWLGTLERVVGRAAHEVKGALNGVGVNLEVVRMRSAKPEAPASAVASFAHTAGEQLEVLTGMTEALLALSRPARHPTELGAILAQYSVLLVPAARADGVALEVPTRLAESAPLAVAGDVARMVIGAALLAAVDGRRDAACTVELAESADVQITSDDAGALQLPPDIVVAATDAGVQVRQDAKRLTISFPRSRATAHETA